MNILIVKLSAIGDVVHALPFLEALRKKFRGARIDWVVEEDSSQILFGHPALNRVIVSRRKSWQIRLTKTTRPVSVIRDICHFLNELRSSHYDLVIDLQGLLKSGVWVGLSKGRRKIGISGSREGAGCFLSERPIPVNYGQHAIDRYLRVAEYIGCDGAGRGGRIPYDESDRESVDEVLDRHGIQHGPLVAINPMAKWPTKLWEAERFAVLARRIRDELGCEVVFTGSNSDRPVIRRMMGRMPSPPLNLAGQTSLKELAYLYTRCKLLVTTDTGPMHMAAAMGCRVVALFGPTAPWRTGPYGKGHKVIRSGIGCSPCFKKRCDHMTCMKEIGVDQVFEAVEKALRNSGIWEFRD
ncbi:MAG: Lipopolysaccharide heptosyltransferase [Thermodesulfobacteriota bacterium]|nr:Lipopolysaccharide heptosyltransferase [Thermodesulfobacteriota bacterium]